MNVMWFRRDLRLLDNPAFHHSVTNGPTVAVYCLNDVQWDEHLVSQWQRSLIIAQLNELEKELAKLAIPLVILHSKTFKNAVNVLLEFMGSIDAQRLYFNEEYEVNERQLTLEIRSGASSYDVFSFHDQCLIEPGEILNNQDQPYKVFTAFKKSYLGQMSSKMRPLYTLPNMHPQQSLLTIKSNLVCLQSLHINQTNTQILAGEDKAHAQLAEFAQCKLADYKNLRDIPSQDGTSQVSAYLAIGMISVRQCWQEASAHATGAYEEGYNTWVSELIWRDFYRHLIFFYPRLCKGQAFKKDTDRLPWKHDEVLFEKWKQGKTGYPIVDAAMRQLNATGWMHNRLRMIVAMFLSKHLFLDWRLGERYFMAQLIDGDLASNNGGWQWSASTGVDAVPYFRIFNPVRQSERFDSKGDFIRQYLPELRSLDNKSIHMPSTQQAQSLGYPLPIVNHKQAVEQTKLWFKSLSDPECNPMALDARNNTNNRDTDLFGEPL